MARVDGTSYVVESHTVCQLHFFSLFTTRSKCMDENPVHLCVLKRLSLGAASNVRGAVYSRYATESHRLGDFDIGAVAPALCNPVG